MKIKFPDKEDRDLKNSFLHTNKFINKNIKHTNVLIHCLFGLSSSTAIVIAYLMKYKHKTLENALELIFEESSNAELDKEFLS